MAILLDKVEAEIPGQLTLLHVVVYFVTTRN